MDKETLFEMSADSLEDVESMSDLVDLSDKVAVVSGLSDNVVSTALAADNDDIEANVLSSTVKAPEEWYTPFLDAFFGYAQ